MEEMKKMAGKYPKMHVKRQTILTYTVVSSNKWVLRAQSKKF